MSLKNRLLLWKLKMISKRGDQQTLKHVKIGSSTITYRKSEEVVHAYREIFRDGIYTFRSSTDKPLILDCGAHIGMSVVFFKQLFPGGRIIAFEPDKESFNLLSENAKQFSGVTLEQKAVWIHNNGVVFEQRGDMSSHIDTTTGATTGAIASARLYDYLDQPVDMLKMDIEGAEIDVLKDCKDRLHNVKNMFVEFHGNAEDPQKLESLLALFRECNISYYIKQANDWAPLPFVNMKLGSGWDVQLNIFCINKSSR